MAGFKDALLIMPIFCKLLRNIILLVQYVHHGKNRHNNMQTSLLTLIRENIKCHHSFTWQFLMFCVTGKKNLEKHNYVLCGKVVAGWMSLKLSGLTAYDYCVKHRLHLRCNPLNVSSIWTKSREACWLGKSGHVRICMSLSLWGDATGLAWVRFQVLLVWFTFLSCVLYLEDTGAPVTPCGKCLRFNIRLAG